MEGLTNAPLETHKTQEQNETPKKRAIKNPQNITDKPAPAATTLTGNAAAQAARDDSRPERILS